MSKSLVCWNVIFFFLLGLSSCASNVPADFYMIVDGRRADFAAESPTEHVNLKINQNGTVSYIIYDTSGTITYDAEGMITISRGQIIENGSLKLSQSDMVSLSKSIEESNFFELTEDYRMSIGGAYAFLVVTVNEQTHRVDNIGMDVMEIEKIFQDLNAVLPDKLSLEYSQEGTW